MNGMPIRWKVKPILDAHSVESNYRFWRDSQLSRVTAYAIADGTHEALDVSVLDKLMPYLQKLTGNKDLQLGDVVEWVSEDAQA